MKNQTKIILIGIILLVIGFIFFYPRMSLFTNSDSTNAESTAQSAKSNLPVEVIELKEENLETSLNITGTLIPNEIVNLRPEVAGLVEKITFQEGQFVRIRSS